MCSSDLDLDNQPIRCVTSRRRLRRAFPAWRNEVPVAVINGIPNQTNTLNGTSGADTITGANKSDTLSGANGSDTLVGNQDADTLYGNAYHFDRSYGFNAALLVRPVP